MYVYVLGTYIFLGLAVEHPTTRFEFIPRGQYIGQLENEKYLEHTGFQICFLLRSHPKVIRHMGLSYKQYTELLKICDRHSKRVQENHFEFSQPKPPKSNTFYLLEVDRIFCDCDREVAQFLGKSRHRRAVQIIYQVMGVTSAIEVSAVRHQLQVSDDQRRELRRQVKLAQNDRLKVYRDPMASADKRKQAEKQYKKQLNKIQEEILTQKQRLLWNELVGEPFDVD